VCTLPTVWDILGVARSGRRDGVLHRSWRGAVEENVDLRVACITVLKLGWNWVALYLSRCESSSSPVARNGLGKSDSALASPKAWHASMKTSPEGSPSTSALFAFWLRSSTFPLDTLS